MYVWVSLVALHVPVCPLKISNVIITFDTIEWKSNEHKTKSDFILCSGAIVMTIQWVHICCTSFRANQSYFPFWILIDFLHNENQCNVNQIRQSWHSKRGRECPKSFLLLMHLICTIVFSSKNYDPMDFHVDIVKVFLSKCYEWRSLDSFQFDNVKSVEIVSLFFFKCFSSLRTFLASMTHICWKSFDTDFSEEFVMQTNNWNENLYFLLHFVVNKPFFSSFFFPLVNIVFQQLILFFDSSSFPPFLYSTESLSHFFS